MSLRRHTTYNLIGACAPIVISLLTVPAYLHQIGEARFGIMSIAWLLLGYFGVFDLGLGLATAQRIAAERNEGTAARARTLWTALTANSLLGVVGGCLILPIAYAYFSLSIKVDASLRAELIEAVPWLALAVPIATATGVLAGALQGMQRFAALNVASLIGTVFFQVVPLAAATFYSPRLTVILPVSLASRLVWLLVLAIMVKRDLAFRGPFRFSGSEFRGLLGFGGWVTVSSFVSPLMVIVDRFVIGSLSGAKAVSYYAVSAQLAERTGILADSLSSALLPRLARSEPREMRRLAVDSERTLMILMLGPLIVAIYALPVFLRLWVGAEFAQRATLAGQILLLGNWINSVARVPLARLMASGRPSQVAKCHLVEVLPYWVLLYFAVARFGPAGASLAFVCRVTVDFVLLASFADTFRPVFRMAIFGLGSLAVAILVSAMTPIFSTGWLLLLTLQAVTVAVWSVINCPPAAKSLLTSRLRWFRQSAHGEV